MIIYSDDDVIAVNKKCGEAVQPGPGVEESLIEKLSDEFGTLYPVHRIDRPVSGIVLFARTKKAAAALSAGFATDGKIKKTYLCAVDSPPPAESGVLENYILIPSGKKANKVYIKNESGKNTKRAVLEYRLAAETERYHILEIILRTGRKHQIRAQLANIGCHVKGDLKYGARRSNRGGGISLHALSLSFTHPSTGEMISLTAPLPDDPLWKAAAGGLKSAPGSDQQDN